MDRFVQTTLVHPNCIKYNYSIEDNEVIWMTSEFAIAVHALVFLNHRGVVLTSDELAENVCTNPARIRKVMTRLKKAGLVQTKEGVDGGYHLELPADRIDLCRVDEAVNVRIVSAAWRSGDAQMECLVASGMADIMDEIYEDLNERCKQHLRSITIADIDQRIFG